MSKLGDVYKKSGLPTHTFVEPTEYNRVVVALQTQGRGLIIEGPSGIGKTSCIKKALESQSMASSCLFLSARRPSDLEYINDLHTMRKIGVVVIDDFHRLSEETKKKITDYMKVLADEEDNESKVILIGINRAGQSLIEYAPDLLHRAETIRVGRSSEEKIEELIRLGERALNCKINTADQIVSESEGSFGIAQVLCHEACLQGKVLETLEISRDINVSLPSIRENVLRELSPRFLPVAREFATGNKLRREGRAPYLHLLRWLSESSEGVLDTKEALVANPMLRGSVSQVIEKEHLAGLINKNKEVGDLIHFDPKSELLSAEDPKFLYFVRHLIWSKFARQIGYYNIEFGGKKYDFALSFAGEERALAEKIFQELEQREISVFYDKNEQHRILGNDVEEYLAPIYRSESRFVVVFLSKDYPKKIWTKFESDQFKERFGDDSVIPISFKDCPTGIFDETRKIGGMMYDPSNDLDKQSAEIAEVLSQKLREERQADKANEVGDESEGVLHTPLAETG